MNWKMKSKFNSKRSSVKLIRVLLFVSMAVTSSVVQAATVSYAGPLKEIVEDSGAATYSGVTAGTGFAGEIDDTALDGFITDGSTATTFPCCIGEASGLLVLNNETLGAFEAGIFNSVLGTSFVEGDMVDVIVMEGATTIDSGGLMKITLNMIFNNSEFDNYDPSHYPPSLENAVGNLFFVSEQDADGNEIYFGVGSADQVTIEGQ